MEHHRLQFDWQPNAQFAGVIVAQGKPVVGLGAMIQYSVIGWMTLEGAGIGAAAYLGT